MKTLIAATIMLATVASVPAQGQTREERQKIARIIVFGNDPCPRGQGGEIIVCARRPESDRNRLPDLGERTPGPEGQSWSARARGIEDVGRTGTDSCSTVGAGGQTGCAMRDINNSRVGMDGKQQPDPQG